MENTHTIGPSWASVAGSEDHHIQQSPPDQEQYPTLTTANEGGGPDATEARATEEVQPESKIAIKDTPNMANLNREIALLNATVSTLEDDLKRRTSDLIEIRSGLLSKTAEVDHLKSKVASLGEELKSAKARMNENTRKDTEIAQLRSEVSGLRESLHTGVISVAQLYGSGSVEAFHAACDNATKMAKQGVRINGQLQRDPRHQQTKAAPPLVNGVQHPGNASTKTSDQQSRQSIKGDHDPREPTRVPSQNRPLTVANDSNNNIAKGTARPPPSNNVQKKDAGGKNTPVVRLPRNTPKYDKRPQGSTNSSHKAPLCDVAEEIIHPVCENDEWITIPVKNKPAQAKGKKKRNGKGKGDARGKEDVNSSTKPQKNQDQPSQKNAGSSQHQQQASGANGGGYKRPKKMTGTVIGSASGFSQKPEQGSEQPAQKEGNKTPPAPVVTPIATDKPDASSQNKSTDEVKVELLNPTSTNTASN
ncbi:hypothetical protein F4805DRAFT_477052 [Annulohypoxylon moriforme]|nr:hypothetical protein F4805DRAFT_477052 [Annulohypoxylon moriforme]